MVTLNKYSDEVEFRTQVEDAINGISGGAWGSITGTLSDQTDLQSALDAKQATLVSGTNIKTVNGSSIVGSGNVVISSAVAWGAVTGTLSDQTDLQSALDAKQATITAGTTGQYYRGDKTFQTLDKSAVGLGNVDNTSDANKPVSTATQTALDLKANLASPTFTGTVVLPASQVVNGVTLTAAGASTDYLSADGSYSAPPSSISMSSGAITTTSSSSNTVWSTVTGAGVSVTSGKTYRIRWMLRTYSAAATTGVGLRRALDTATGTVYGWHALGMSNATAVISQSSREGTVDQFIATGNATSTTSVSGSYMVETLFACTGSGTFNLEMRSEVSASSATIDGDGSYWVAEEW